jgi:hypothetical protein
MGIYPSGHSDPIVRDVIAILEDWCVAMEEGTHIYRFPDDDYKKKWTEEKLDKIIDAIDEEMDKEIKTTPGVSVSADAGPDFKRLDYDQKLALVQDLDRELDKDRILLPSSKDYDYNGEGA